jgi:2-O-A-mannosyl-D-glycerate PTS system EIIABC component
MEVVLMDLTRLTNENLIFLEKDFSAKKEVLKFLVAQLYKQGKLKDENEFLNAVYAREEISHTGLESGIAIPHGKSKSVKEASFAFIKVNNPIKDWESIVDDNEVKYIFLLAIPEEEAGSTHLELLAELMKKVSDDDYIENLFSSKSSKEFYDKLTHDTVKKIQEKTYDKTVLAITACAAGIAHTYMASESLIKAGESMNVKVYVEKQGANGIEDRHTKKQLESADAVIFAADVAVKDRERYSHLPIYETRVSEPIKDGKKVIENALERAKTHKKGVYVSNDTDEDNKKSFVEEVKQSVLTGISYIIPIIVAGGMIGAFAVLCSNIFGLQELYGLENSWLWMFRKLGGNMLGTLMIPILSAYMAYSISDKTALAPGFAAGLAANMVNGGFLCGMLGGLFAGYTIRFMRKALPAKGTFAGFISFWVYPVFSTIFVGIFMFFIIGSPIGWINHALVNFLGSLSGSNAILLGIILGVMVSFDLGGPVNKAAYTFCVGAMAEGVIIPYAIFASVKMVSAFAVTFSTLGFKKYFTEDEQQIGKSTWILGLAGITEGAIPFMMKDPINIVFSLCAGSAVTGAIVSSFNVGLDVPGAGIFSLFMLKTSDSSIVAALVWFFAAVLGALISTGLLIATRKAKLKKNAIAK